MKLLRIFIKTPLLVSTVLVFFILGLLNKGLFFFSLRTRQWIAQRNTQWACYLCLKIFNIKCTYQLAEPPQGSLLVSNHISYTDVLVIASRIPTLFVTSLELKRSPFLGQISQIGECLYVDRKSHKNISLEIEKIKQTLSRGFNVLIFPEATTSDGTFIKPYKSSLLQLADHFPVSIHNLCIQYTHANSTKFTAESVTEVSWTHNKSFLKHAFHLMSLKSLSVALTEADSLSSSNFTDRKQLTQHLYQSVTALYTRE